MPHALVCGERSGRFRDALRARGWRAYSNDLESTRVPGPHIQDDWRNVIPLRVWDLIIIHFDCTAVAVSGNHVYAAGKPKHHMRLAACKAIDADWDLVRANSRHAVAENPVGVIPTMTRLGKPSQIVQPYTFGDDASKATGLWIFNLPRLRPTLRVAGRRVEWPAGSGKIRERWANQTDSGQNRLGPSDDRKEKRAETYPGIATAGADQWSAYLQISLQVAA